MSAAEQLRAQFQKALDDADKQITVAEALNEIVYLLSIFTVSEDVDDREIAVFYQQTCHKMRLAIGAGKDPAGS